MSTLRNLTCGLLAVGAATVLYRKFSGGHHSVPVMFIDDAMLQSLGIIEAARLAQERTRNDKVKNFAQKMIEDHMAINRELQQLAASRGYQVAGEDALAPKARNTLLNLKAVQSFDLAYAEHQITAHRKAISLYRRGVRIDDFDVSNFVRKALREMEHHLAMAERLADTVNADLAPATAADAAATAEVSANESGLSSGSPQQNRGDATNPHH
ncbi:Predicted outer membrane protein [Halopseudomonas litoralis]|uniref:Predicted outer membrane protein n=1 Tax=Halopseudomonas litoralis TaxID=797277 RepID=A0A1H1P648_9GAMM|nr:DUF4142 domain-containing protein [Halopseudomonas litoralis]SDS06099.1 Predicted outer membrane protein [Halopseudomonas litoralis]